MACPSTGATANSPAKPGSMANITSPVITAPQHSITPGCESTRRKLVSFLERRAFDPVLRADSDDYPERKRDKLERVQRATEDERERFRAYGSASEVVRMFKDDLSSEPAKDVHRDLRDLGLPTLDDVRDDFEDLARRLKVS